MELQEIKDEIKSMFPHADVRINLRDDLSASIDLHSYRSLNVKFSHLKRLSEIFETDSINFGDQYKIDGCETCDHGASWNATLEIRNSPAIRRMQEG